MKTYQYQFTKLVKILLYLLVALCVLCIGFSIFRIVAYALPSLDEVSFRNWMEYFVPIAVGIFGIVVSLSMLIKSQYEITDEEMRTRFGVIVSRYGITDIIAVHLFTKTKKLAVYFKNDRYLVIVVKEEWYRDFIKDLISRNNKIAYDESEEQSKEDLQ